MANTKHQECEAPGIMPDAPAKTNNAAVAVVEIKSKTELDCELTEAELVEVAKATIEKQREIDQLDKAKKASTAHYNERIKSATEDRDELMRKFDSRKERRVVDTVWKLNYPEPGMKTLYREDTGAPIGSAEMTTADRDQNLPGIVEAADAEVVVEDEFPEEVPDDTDPELDAAEAAENARADEIIANLKDDDEDY